MSISASRKLSAISLKQGVAPWRSNCFATVGFHKNFTSGKEYRGINLLLLGSLLYTSAYFVTFLQARELGGHVLKGEMGMMVVKYGTYEKETPLCGAVVKDEGGSLKSFTVFNVSRIDGVEFPESELVAP